MTRYYIDACIWRDYFEDRRDKFRPLGEWALRMLRAIIEDNDIILYSEIVEDELRKAYSQKEITDIFSLVPPEIFIKVEISENQRKEAFYLSRKLKMFFKDVLHAVLARDNNALLVSRDKHFYELQEYVEIKRPEDLI